MPSNRLPTDVVIDSRSVPDLPQSLHHSSVAHRVLAARGITTASELTLTLTQLPRPDLLPDIDIAVQRLLEAREKNEKVLIIGDYDCDGATSTAVAMIGLAMLGFRNLDYFIPSRFKYGYGLSPAIVDLAAQRFNAQLLLTVDNGVASVDGVEQANKQGMDVVITDHHLAPDVLPAAKAIVNPNLPGAQFASKNLAGVGVIFYTLLALRARLKYLEDPACKAPLANLLDLVAVGTVADVVPLDATNRILVEQGLRRIRSGNTRPGIAALLSVAGKRAEALSTQDIGFGIAPRLNAAGRLQDMKVGVCCLISEDATVAKALAQELNDLNQQRRSIESKMCEAAEEQLSNLPLQTRDDSFGICVKDELWHEGVIGILAGRIKESLNKPVIVFTADGDDALKGSARSTAGVHIRDVLQNIVAQHPGMISKFGGHAMAAGLTLPKEHFETFKSAFDATVRQKLNGRHQRRQILTDGALSHHEITLDNANVLSTLMPWGQGFEIPVFQNEFKVHSVRSVGTGHLKLSLLPLPSRQHANPIAAIAFNCAVDLRAGDAIKAVYVLDVNLWQGNYSLQLRVDYLEPSALR